MKDVAIVSFAQSDCVRDAGAANEVELIMPVIKQVLETAGLNGVHDVDFTCSGSCDYQQGAAFAATTRAVWGLDLPDMAFPVAVGRAASLASLPLEPVLRVWLQAFLSNLVQAAQRLMSLGQTEGQRVLAELTPAIIAVADAAQSATLDDIGSATFAVDTASMQHESSQGARLFRS